MNLICVAVETANNQFLPIGAAIIATLAIVWVAYLAFIATILIHKNGCAAKAGRKPEDQNGKIT